MATTEDSPPSSPELLTPRELAARWGLSVHTLENWRSAKRGPQFIKVGRLVRYRLPAVEQFEQEGQVAAPASSPAPPPAE